MRCGGSRRAQHRGCKCAAVHAAPVALEMFAELEAPFVAVRCWTTKEVVHGLQDVTRNVLLTARHRGLPVPARSGAYMSDTAAVRWNRGSTQTIFAPRVFFASSAHLNPQG